MLGQEEQQVEKKARARALLVFHSVCLYSSLAHVVVTGAPKKIEHRYSHLVLPNRVVICGFLISISQIRQISVLIGEKSA